MNKILFGQVSMHLLKTTTFYMHIAQWNSAQVSARYIDIELMYFQRTP